MPTRRTFVSAVIASPVIAQAAFSKSNDQDVIFKTKSYFDQSINTPDIDLQMFERQLEVRISNGFENQQWFYAEQYYQMSGNVVSLNEGEQVLLKIINDGDSDKQIFFCGLPHVMENKINDHWHASAKNISSRFTIAKNQSVSVWIDASEIHEAVLINVDDKITSRFDVRPCDHLHPMVSV